jgi:hypothetical protein
MREVTECTNEIQKRSFLGISTEMSWGSALVEFIIWSIRLWFSSGTIENQLQEYDSMLA